MPANYGNIFQITPHFKLPHTTPYVYSLQISSTLWAQTNCHNESKVSSSSVLHPSWLLRDKRDKSAPYSTVWEMSQKTSSECMTATDSIPYCTHSSALDFSLPKLYCNWAESHIEQDQSSTSQTGDERCRESLCRATCWNAKSSVLQGEKREYPIGWHWQNMGLASRHKGAFRDALALCYGWTPSHIPSQCACGKCFTMEHAFSCPYGDFLLVQHNDIRDTTACLLFSKVCRNVALEPSPMARTLKGKALA